MFTDRAILITLLASGMLCLFVTSSGTKAGYSGTYMGSADLKSGPRVCVTSSLITKPDPKFRKGSLKHPLTSLTQSLKRVANAEGCGFIPEHIGTEAFVYLVDNTVSISLKLTPPPLLYSPLVRPVSFCLKTFSSSPYSNTGDLARNVP